MSQAVFMIKNNCTISRILFAVFFIGTFCLADRAQASYSISTFGSPGTDPGQFDRPIAIAVDSSKNIFVADSMNGRIQKFDSNGNFLLEWGSYGDGDSQFGSNSADSEYFPTSIGNPYGIAIDSTDHIYVIDTAHRSVKKFDDSGNFVLSWGDLSSQSNTHFSPPYGIAIDPSDNVYIANYVDDRIQKYDSNGNILLSWGHYGTGDDEFLNPYGIVSDSLGNIYVTDGYNGSLKSRVLKFDSNGNYLSAFGSYGTGGGQFIGLYSAPFGITTDSSNNIYIADIVNNRIVEFNLSENFVRNFGPNIYAYGAMARDSDDNLYVTDPFSDVVIKFTKTPVAVSNDGAQDVYSTFTLNGSIDDIGGANATERGFVYGTDSSYGATTTPETGEFGVGGFTADISGLLANTTYHFRAYAIGPEGLAYSPEETFFTSLIPTLSASSAYSITQTSATIDGSIDNTGAADSTEHGFVYGTDSSYGATTTPETGDFGSGTSFTVSLTGLTPDTTYYFRAYAINPEGIAYSGEGTFISSTTVPTIIAFPVSSATQTSATLNGSIENTGGVNPTIRGFEYGNTGSYGTIASTTGNYPTGLFSIGVNSLTCGTSYYFRAFAVNSTGAASSTGLTFNTSTCSTNTANPAPTAVYSGSSGGHVNLSTLVSLGLALQPVLSCPSGFSCTPAIFSRNLSIGDIGDDVKSLQQYLNSHGYVLSAAGSGSPGKETAFFGSLTKKTLVRFQREHSIPATGYFGPITRRYINPK